jgi:EmrB/QacA subfamily drug resistance transporter
VGDLSWRFIFLFNVPVCLVALVLAWRAMPSDPPRGGRRLDALGLALLSPAVAALVYGLARVGPSGGFADASVLVPSAIGLGLLVAFVVHALGTRAEPIVDLRLFRVRSFWASACLLFLAGLSLYGALLLLPLFYQRVRGEDVLAAGLLLVPQGIGALLVRVWAGELTDRVGARPVVLVGIALSVAGTLPFALAGPDTGQLLLDAALVVRGAGLGAVIVPVMAAAYQGLPEKQIPHASNAIRIAQQVGGAFGAAVLAVVLDGRTAGNAIAGGPGIVAAFDRAFWWSVGFAVLAFVPALLLPRRKCDRSHSAAGTINASPDAQ